MRKVICLVGPSGVGKTTCIKYLVENFDLIAPVKVTTREKRSDDYGNYDYLTKEEFKRMIREEALLEWDSFGDHHYGITLQSYAEARREDRDLVMDVTIQGGRQIKEQIPFAHIIAMVPSSVDLLVERLKKRYNGESLSRIEDGINFIDRITKQVVPDAVITVCQDASVESICEQILFQVN